MGRNRRTPAEPPQAVPAPTPAQAPPPAPGPTPTTPPIVGPARHRDAPPPPRRPRPARAAPAAPAGWPTPAAAPPVAPATTARTQRQPYAPLSTIPSGEIQTLPAQSFGDVFFTQPGATSSTFAPGASRPILRGLGDDRIRVQENGLAPATSPT